MTERRQKKQYVGFRTWLTRQRGRDGPIGDLGTDVLRDRQFPRTYQAAYAYLEQRGAGDGVRVALAEAWREYAEYLRVGYGKRRGK